jgi:hypothetical protein
MTQRSKQSHSWVAFVAMASLGLMLPHLSCGEVGLHKVNYVIITQENHSFDNYFGALALAPGSPYHQPNRDNPTAGCANDDHTCVDGVTCHLDTNGNFVCSNSNPDAWTESEIRSVVGLFLLLDRWNSSSSDQTSNLTSWIFRFSVNLKCEWTRPIKGSGANSMLEPVRVVD